MQQWSSLLDKVVHQMLSEWRNYVVYNIPYYIIIYYIIPLEYIGQCSCHGYVSIYECCREK